MKNLILFCSLVLAIPALYSHRADEPDAQPIEMRDMLLDGKGLGQPRLEPPPLGWTMHVRSGRIIVKPTDDSEKAWFDAETEVFIKATESGRHFANDVPINHKNWWSAAHRGKDACICDWMALYYSPNDGHLPGDANQDGKVDKRDDEPFQLALRNPVEYTKKFGVDPKDALDMTMDGVVTEKDYDEYSDVLIFNGMERRRQHKKRASVPKT